MGLTVQVHRDVHDPFRRRAVPPPGCARAVQLRVGHLSRRFRPGAWALTQTARAPLRGPSLSSTLAGPVQKRPFHAVRRPFYVLGTRSRPWAAVRGETRTRRTRGHASEGNCHTPRSSDAAFVYALVPSVAASLSLSLSQARRRGDAAARAKQLTCAAVCNTQQNTPPPPRPLAAASPCQAGNYTGGTT